MCSFVDVKFERKQNGSVFLSTHPELIIMLHLYLYLGRNISENGRVDVVVRRRMQSGKRSWRKVEGVMMNRNISTREHKGKVLDSCVISANMEPMIAYVAK